MPRCRRPTRSTIRRRDGPREARDGHAKRANVITASRLDSSSPTPERSGSFGTRNGHRRRRNGGRYTRHHQPPAPDLPSSPAHQAPDGHLNERASSTSTMQPRDGWPPNSGAPLTRPTPTTLQRGPRCPPDRPRDASREPLHRRSPADPNTERANTLTRDAAGIMTPSPVGCTTPRENPCTIGRRWAEAPNVPSRLTAMRWV